MEHSNTIKKKHSLIDLFLGRITVVLAPKGMETAAAGMDRERTAAAAMIKY
jgi:hypothetical protein